MITCDLCGQSKECLPKEMEGKEYDICAECWAPLAQKLRGKGRTKNTQFVLLPPPSIVRKQEPEEPAPNPGEPPKIWGALQVP